MRLRNDSIMADYPATFAQQMVEDHTRDWVHVGDTYVQLPQPIKIKCDLKFEV
jgi:hypothetical protein